MHVFFFFNHATYLQKSVSIFSHNIHAPNCSIFLEGNIICVLIHVLML